MKNFKKNTLRVLSATALALALTACDKADRNVLTPTGSNINLGADYASVTNGETKLSVSYNEVYNKFRQNGYSDVLKEMKKNIIANEIKDAKYDNYVKAYNSLIFSNVYGSNTIKTFNDADTLAMDSIKEKVDSFADTVYKENGIAISQNDINFLKSYAETLRNKKTINDAIDFTGHSELKAQFESLYSYSIALTNLSRTYNNLNSDKEKVWSYDDNKEVLNSNQITDEKVKAAYQTGYYKYYQAKAIVIRFKNYAEASSIKGIDNSKALSDFVFYYNSNNTDKKPLEEEDPFANNNEATVFYYDTKNSDLSSTYSSDLESFILDDLKDGEYTATPRKIGDSYYLVYRQSVNYYYGNGTGYDFETAKDIKLSELKSKFGDSFDNYLYRDFNDKVMDDNSTLYDYIKQGLIENNVSESNGDTLVTQKLKHNCKIEIFDPVFENQFYNSYKDNYSFTKNFDNSSVYKITYTNDSFTHDNTSDDSEQTYTYSVEDFFNNMDKVYGINYSVDLLTNKFVLNSSLDALCTNKEIEEFTSSAKEAVKKFNKDETTYSKKMGLDNYLILTYGITPSGNGEQDLANYLKASNLVSKYSTYYGYFIDGTDVNNPVFKDSGLFANLKKFTDLQKKKTYNISANHFLISVDPDVPGTHVDPRTYIERLDKVDPTKALSNKFKEAVFTLNKLISEEAKLITEDSKDSLKRLAQAYNNPVKGYKLQSQYASDNNYKEFGDFQEKYDEFNFYITAEDLGQITQSSVSSYVEEFKDYINNEIVAKLTDEIKTAINKDGKLYEPASYDEMCLTQFGYHIINVYSQTNPTSCQFSYDDDSKNKDESYKVWEHKEITVSTMNPDKADDDMIVYVSGYSNDEYVSAEQLFMAFFDSYSNMKTTVSDAVKTYSEDVISKYTNASFAKFRLLSQMLGYSSIVKGTYTDGKYNKDLTFSSIKFFNNNGSLDDSKTSLFTKYVYNLTYAVSSGAEFEEDSIYNEWFNTDFTVDLSLTSHYHYDI